MRWIYTLFIYLSVPFVLLRLLWRSRKIAGYRRGLLQRFGFCKKLSAKAVIWLHAVSVGESIAAAPLVKLLQQHYPQHQLLITNTTPTGLAQVQKLFKGSVDNCFLPFDLPGSLKRFIRRTRPHICIIMETELWPNLLHVCAEKNVPTLLANARLSASSYRGYKRIAFISKPMMKNITQIAAQTASEGERYIDLGLSANKLNVCGNIKFDIKAPAGLIDQAHALKQTWGERLVWVAASTHPGEEEIILKAHAKVLQQHPTALLILVPRHPNRFAQVAQLCRRQQFNFVYRSQQQTPTMQHSILLGDSMGELKLFYACADVAFIGGSFVPVGGHNMMEAAIVAKPLITARHVHNFLAISQMFIDAKAMLQVSDAEQLAQSLLLLFADAQLRLRMGEAAFAVIERNRGALAKHLKIIASLLRMKSDA